MAAEYSSITCKTALSLSSLPGLTYSLNPYVGCEHGCAYCYSPSVLKDKQLADKWGKLVRAKSNIAEVLAKEVKHRQKAMVGVSTVTDPYQPIEASLELTRKCIELLSRHDFPVSIQTKSSLVARDADLIKPGKFELGMTLTTMDRELASLLEPMASPPEARAQTIEEFSKNGVETWIFLGPIIPRINDDDGSLKNIIKLAARTKSKIIYDRLNLKQWVMDRLGPKLELRSPGLAKQLPEILNEQGVSWKLTDQKIQTICKQHGVKCEPAFG